MRLISKTDKGNFIFEVTKDEVSKNFRQSSYHDDIYDIRGEYFKYHQEKLNEAIERLSSLLEAKCDILKVFSDCGLSLMELSNLQKRIK